MDLIGKLIWNLNLGLWCFSSNCFILRPYRSKNTFFFPIYYAHCLYDSKSSIKTKSCEEFDVSLLATVVLLISAFSNPVAGLLIQRSSCTSPFILRPVYVFGFLTWILVFTHFDRENTWPFSSELLNEFDSWITYSIVTLSLLPHNIHAGFSHSPFGLDATIILMHSFCTSWSPSRTMLEIASKD